MLVCFLFKQKTEKGWCEVLVDVDDESDSSLRFVLSPGPTAASVSFLKVSWQLWSFMVTHISGNEMVLETWEHDENWILTPINI